MGNARAGSLGQHGRATERSWRDLLELFEDRSSACAERVAFGVLDRENGTRTLSYAELRDRSIAVAAALQQRNIADEPVLIALPTGLEFVEAFFGALLAGALPVPLPVPRYARDRVAIERIAGAASAAAARWIIAPALVAERLAASLPAIRWLSGAQLVQADSAAWERPRTVRSLAYLQFTSGSSGRARGVEVTHAAVLANLATIRRVFSHDGSSSMLTWLPLHHDMGLVGHVLQPLYSGATSWLMSPERFALDPAAWLDAIGRLRATSSGAPAFAYAACAAALEERPRPGLDLSSWQNAYVGADAVHPEVLERFTRAAQPYGFSAASWLPCYGLAEATLFVAGERCRRERQVDAQALARGRAVDAAPGGSSRRVLGFPEHAGDSELMIVDPETGRRASDEHVGEIWVRGAAVGAGYTGDAAATERVFGGRLPAVAGRFLRTGDLGFVSGGALYWVGRSKDLIIVRGVNVCPEDIERTVLAADPGPERLRVACFSLDLGPGEEEGLVILREIARRPRAGLAFAARLDAIVEAVAAAHSLSVHSLWFVPPGSIARTSSGKVSRSACRTAFSSGEVEALAKWSGALRRAASTQLAAGAAERKAAPNVSRDDRVAIIGMACRFPDGADDPAGFWERLWAGVDCVSAVPAERWDAGQYYDPRPALPGKMNTRQGGFVRDVDRFDASFFGIAGHEAAQMDPQQRLLLEVAWRALEHAGVTEAELRGSDTGVFIGISNGDYLRLMVRANENLERFNAYSGLGNAYSIAANRLSYTFDLRGPSVAVDTACSSSLTAIHLAAESVRNGECTMAIAGGVNLLLAPDATILLSQFGMLAPDGRCKAFDAAADGYVRSEGCGLVVLKRGREARLARDPIRAWILGSAQGQDGRSAGITAPNGEAQRAVIERALRRAGARPGGTSYVEAHGTGTLIGDPVELRELRSVYGAAGSDLPCHVGSVKANVGHLEAAAGVAGIIKVVLALQHRRIPAQLHVHRLNPEIRLEGSRLSIPVSPTEWLPGVDEPRQAALSSFGFGGALVHMLLEEASEPSVSREPPRRGDHHRLLVLSAKTPAALGELANRWANRLEEERFEPLRALCHAAACRRTHFRYRLAIVGASQGELRSALRRATPCDADASAGVGGHAFMFSGQGSAYAGMGRHLHAEHEVFRAAFARCAAALGEPGASELLAMVAGPEAPERRGGPSAALTQPLLFALEFALAQLWMSWGVTPALVFGHSLGEIAAGCVAGCMAPEDGMRLVAARGRLMAEAPGPGAMLSVAATEDRLSALIELDAMGLSIAAINAPNMSVISGPSGSVRRAEEQLRAAGVRTWALDVAHAFHSSLMDPILDEFEAIAAGIEFRPPALPLWSSLTGERLLIAPSARYFREHLRRCVRFRDVVDAVIEEGIRSFVEIGPGRTSCSFVQQCRPGLSAWFSPSLDEDEAGTQTSLASLGRLYCAGVPIDWEAVYGGPAPMPWELPEHPFERQRFWFDTPPPQPAPIEARSADRLPIFGVAWSERPLPSLELPAGPRGAHWIIVGDGAGLGAALARDIEARGDVVYLLQPPLRGSARKRLAAWVGRGARQLRISHDPDAAELAERINHVTNRLGRYEASRWRVIDVGALDGSRATDGSGADAQAEDGVARLVALLQALSRVAIHLPLWIVTQHAQAISSVAPQGMPDLSAAALWGLARTAFLERPELRGGLIDVERGEALEASARRVVDQILLGVDEAQVAFRQGKRHVQALLPLALEAAQERPAIHADASYFITGGLGGIGLSCARWLVEHGARRLVLAGRSCPPHRSTWGDVTPGSRWAAVVGVLEELEARGVRIDLVECDVREPAALARALAVARAAAPLRGVFHAAGVNWFGKIDTLDRAELIPALAIKMSAAWNLHASTLDDELDYFVAFSSVSALWGSVDLGHYTASNHYLDALCHYRRQGGRPALSINWGPWSEVGMSAGPREEKLLTMLGLRLLPPERALAALGRLMVSGQPQAVVADIDWGRFQSFADFASSPTLFERIRASRAAAPVLGSVRELAALSPAAAEERLVQVLLAQLATVLHAAPGTTLDVQTRFNVLGMDSLTAMAFCARIEAATGLEVPATTVYNHPTVGKLAAHLRNLAANAAPPERGRAGELFAIGQEKPARDFRLFCFPYAGGGPSVFADWSEALPRAVRVVPLQLPGREGRSSEPPMTSFVQLVTAIVDALEPHTASPFGFFGHSFGALLSFGVTRELARRRLPLPDPLVLSGYTLPRPGEQTQLHRLDDVQFLRELSRRFGVVPATTEQGPSGALLAAIRADLAVAETLPAVQGEPIPCSMHVFGGREDKVAPPERLGEWAAMTTRRSTVRLFEGDHMFVRGPAKAGVIAAVTGLIDQRMSQPPMEPS